MDCILHSILKLLVFLDELSNLLILAAYNLFQFFLLFFQSFHLFLIELFEFFEVALSNLMILLSAFLVVDLGLHVGPLYFSLHLLHP